VAKQGGPVGAEGEVDGFALTVDLLLLPFVLLLLRLLRPGQELGRLWCLHEEEDEERQDLELASGADLTVSSVLEELDKLKQLFDFCCEMIFWHKKTPKDFL